MFCRELRLNLFMEKKENLPYTKPLVLTMGLIQNPKSKI